MLLRGWTCYVSIHWVNWRHTDWPFLFIINYRSSWTSCGNIRNITCHVLINNHKERLYVSVKIWDQCLVFLQEEYSAQQFNTWLRPLQAELQEKHLILLAPNRFVVDWVKKHFYERIQSLVTQISDSLVSTIAIERNH